MMLLTRLRVVLPPDWAVLTLVLTFGLTEFPLAYLEWQVKQPLDIPRLGLFLLRMAAFAYGTWRAGALHPAYQSEYRAWLERSPWTSRRPLPAGPIALAWEDLLPLAALAILARFVGPMAPVAILGLFLAGYSAAIALSLFRTGVPRFGYGIAFGLGLGLRLWPDPWYFLGSMVATYLVALAGLRIGLAMFPWPGFEGFSAASQVAKMQEKICGWPFDQLQPQVEGASKLRPVDGILIGLLGGWFLFAAESLFRMRADREILVRLVFGCGVMLLASIRTLVYCAGLAPPISLWGRIRTFRWIVPGFDQVFLTPLCTLLIGVLGFDRFRPPGLDDLAFLPMALALAIAVAITSGPSYLRWRLTGRHRFVSSTVSMNPEYVKVG